MNIPGVGNLGSYCRILPNMPIKVANMNIFYNMLARIIGKQFLSHTYCERAYRGAVSIRIHCTKKVLCGSIHGRKAWKHCQYPPLGASYASIATCIFVVAGKSMDLFLVNQPWEDLRVWQPASKMAPNESHLLGFVFLYNPLPHCVRAGLCNQ